MQLPIGKLSLSVCPIQKSTGSFNGTLSKLKASDLGSVVIQEVLRRANVEGQQVSEVILGQVGSRFLFVYARFTILFVM